MSGCQAISDFLEKRLDHFHGLAAIETQLVRELEG